MVSTCKIDADGGKQWWVNGKLHRDDGPAIELADGTCAWYQNDMLHRTDGPALLGADGYNVWYCNGKLHRTDGPAIEYANGDKEYYINDIKLTSAEFAATLDKDTALLWKISGYCWPFDFGVDNDIAHKCRRR
jgi:hypothetical protein